MILREPTPQLHDFFIKPEVGKSLQAQVTEALKNGIQRVILEGKFDSGGKNPFSLLTINQDLEIIGEEGTTFEGQGRLTHLVFVKDGVRVRIKGVKFANGNTGNTESQISLENHPLTRTNVFRYLDGGAISCGVGSELLLEDCDFVSNHSAVCGGAISNLGGYIHLINCSFVDNTCGDTGAAIDNLVAGSLTVIDKGRFINNRANLLGTGNFGAVTVFPNTFLIVKDSDFTSERYTAVDYRPNKYGEAFVAIDQLSVFNSQNLNPIVRNPISNRGSRKEIVTRYIRLLSRHPALVKFEGVPGTNRATVEKHRELFNKIVASQQNRIMM